MKQSNFKLPLLRFINLIINNNLVFKIKINNKNKNKNILRIVNNIENIVFNQCNPVYSEFNQQYVDFINWVDVDNENQIQNKDVFFDFSKIMRQYNLKSNDELKESLNSIVTKEILCTEDDKSYSVLSENNTELFLMTLPNLEQQVKIGLDGDNPVVDYELRFYSINRNVNKLHIKLIFKNGNIQYCECHLKQEYSNYGEFRHSHIKKYNRPELALSFITQSQFENVLQNYFYLYENGLLDKKLKDEIEDEFYYQKTSQPFKHEEDEFKFRKFYEFYLKQLNLKSDKKIGEINLETIARHQFKSIQTYLKYRNPDFLNEVIQKLVTMSNNENYILHQNILFNIKKEMIIGVLLHYGLN